MNAAAVATARVAAAEKFAEECRQTLGSEAAVSGEATAPFAVDGQRPAVVCFPSTVEELSRCVAAAAEAQLAMIPVGNGTQLGIGRSPRRYDIAMCTRRMSRIVAHEAADMTVTVEAGATLDELNATLATAGQFLPLDPPHPRDITVGGLIATDASGPSRLAYGKVRDLLIGVRAVLADGTVVKGGGRVVKNVAGYDLMKLLTGSHGSLAIIVEATFKIRPRPPEEAVFFFTADELELAISAALHVLNARVQPAFVEVLNPAAAARVLDIPKSALLIGCDGARVEIDAQRREIEAVLGVRSEMLSGTDASSVVTRLRDVSAVPAMTGGTLVMAPSRLGSTLGDISRQADMRSMDLLLAAHAGNGIARFRCANKPNETNAFVEFARWLCGQIAAVGGSVRFDALPAALKDRIDPWNSERELSAAQRSLMRNIKEALDPKGLLSPGCFIAGI